MNAHGVAGDLGDVLVRKGNLVPAVARANQVAQLLGGCQTHLGQHLFHGQLGADLGVDLAADGGIGTDLSVLVQNDRFRVGGAYVTTAVIFHSTYSFYRC